LFLETGNG
jgi:DNA-binding GntR family transcriptional regulator